MSGSRALSLPPSKRHNNQKLRRVLFDVGLKRKSVRPPPSTSSLQESERSLDLQSAEGGQWTEDRLTLNSTLDSDRRSGQPPSTAKSRPSRAPNISRRTINIPLNSSAHGTPSSDSSPTKKRHQHVGSDKEREKGERTLRTAFSSLEPAPSEIMVALPAECEERPTSKEAATKGKMEAVKEKDGTPARPSSSSNTDNKKRKERAASLRRMRAVRISTSPQPHRRLSDAKQANHSRIDVQELQREQRRTRTRLKQVEMRCLFLVLFASVVALSVSAYAVDFHYRMRDLWQTERSEWVRQSCDTRVRHNIKQVNGLWDVASCWNPIHSLRRQRWQTVRDCVGGDRVWMRRLLPGVVYEHDAPFIKREKCEPP